VRRVTVAARQAAAVAPAAQAMLDVLRDVGQRYGGEAAALAAGIR
jgi:hypothetical protein